MDDAPPPSPLATPLAWDLVSAGYAEDIVPQFEQYAVDALDLARVTAGQRVLDVACGPGTLSFQAAKRGATVSAIDFSPAMIAKLAERAKRETELAVEAQVGDGMELPYDARRFDAAFSMFGLMFFPDRARGFAELARVVRPSGRAVVASWTPMERVPAIAAAFRALKEMLPGLPFGEGRAPLGDPAEMVEEMSAAGFTDVRCEERTHATEAPGVDALWTSWERSFAPLVLLKNKLEPAAWSGLGERVRAALRELYGAGPVKIEMTANLGVGTR